MVTKVIEDVSNEGTNYENVGEDYLNMLDDEAADDTRISDEFTRESAEDTLASSDNVDDRTDEYDYSDSFIDDGPLVSDASQYDSDACNSDD